jgi:tetratricopeptide (TPR) repeat protein
VKEAQEVMQRVVTTFSDAPEAQDGRSFLAMIALDGSPKVTSEAPEVQKLLSADPNYVPALMAQASALRQNGDTKGAENIYQRVLQHFPDFAIAQKQLAAIYCVDPANAEKAYDLASKARKSLPEDKELARTLAITSYQKKDFSGAIPRLQESLKEAPNDAIALYYLGMAHVRVGHLSEGRDTLKRALAAGLQSPFADEARKVVTTDEPK